MRVKVDEGSFAPSRAHGTDGGIDIRSNTFGTIPAHGSKVFTTGTHVELPPGTCGILMSKSGLNVNHEITSTGLIDEGYTGEIKVRMYNNGDDDYLVGEGDKITQLVVVPCIYVDVELVDEISESERGDNGFGSTGR